MPAVSMRITRRPSTSSGRSIASRVVPATSETITRSEPGSRVTSVDLAAAGRRVDEGRLADVRPADDSEADRVLVLLLVLGAGQQLDDAVEQVAGAEAL